MNAKKIFTVGFLCLSVILTLIAPATLPVYAAAQNPILWADVPDPSVIRVGNNYYMSSTTMHMNPGVPIMKSTNLINWDIVNYVYPTLGNGDKENLNNGQNEYGKGSWASSLRYKNGTYYLAFMSYTSNNTYIYQTTNIETGTWTKYALGTAYHDSSLLFDDDGKVYLIYGAGDIKVVELNADAKSVKAGGLNKTLITNAGSIAGSGGLAAEGAHAHKINGKYYIFLISWPSGSVRTELVYRADTIGGAYTGQIMLRTSGVGIAQGGVVDTPTGQWYAMLFRDTGAVGRIPYLIPVTWSNNWPVAGSTTDTGINVTVGSNFVACDGFDSGTAPGKMWQWNHNPDNNYWSYNSARPGYFRLTNGSVRANIHTAKNTFTQRTFGGESTAIVAMETGGMKDGDYAGLSAFQFYYGYVGVKMVGTSKSIVMVRGSTNDPNQTSNPVEVASVGLSQSRVYLKVYTDFRNQTDKAYFSYSLDGNTWTTIGSTLQMAYTLPHFMGYRFALFNYGTKSTGGYADFDYFQLQPAPPSGCSIGSSPTATPTRTNTPGGPTPTPTRTPTPGGNLLTNADMENGTTNWVVNGAGTLSSDTTQFHGGARSIKITGRTASWNGIGQNVAVSNFTNGQSYTVSVWVRSQTGTPTASATLRLTAGSTTYVNLASAAINSTGWTQLTGTVPVSWSGTLTGVLFYVETTAGTDNLYIDDASLAGSTGPTPTPTRTNTPGPTATPTRTNTPGPTATPTRTPTPSTNNFLTNADMEAGTTNWVVNGAGTLSSDTTQFHGGARSIKITGRTATWNGIGQNVAVANFTNGQNRTVSVWVRSQTGTPTAKATLRLTASSTTYVTLASAAINSTGWTQLTGTVPVSWSGTLTGVLFYVETAAGTDNLYIDDASLQ